MKNKGFTLIELLAVILILGIIALIAIPVVNNIINESKRGSFKATVQNVLKAAETKCQVEKVKGSELTLAYTFSDTGVTPALDLKGKLPIGGTITVDNECNVTLNNVTDGKYTATKQASNDEIVIAEIVPKVCSATVGDGTNIGDEITCGTEGFYVIATTEDSIKMFAKYNLKVGYKNVNTATLYTESEMTYMQDPEMIGYKPDGNITAGTTVFSSDSKKGTNYSSYEGSIVEGYVNEYKQRLTAMGMQIEEARLITKREIEILVNNGNNLEGENIDHKADLRHRSWIYSTSYWVGTSYNATNIWNINTYGVINVSDYTYSTYGVRPVVVIPKSEI